MRKYLIAAALLAVASVADARVDYAIDLTSPEHHTGTVTAVFPESSLNEKLGKAKVIIDRLLESHGELFQERSNEQSLAEDMRVFFSLIRFSHDSR